ncbi:MAG: PD40 domain-containing protein [Candidatus Zixiibacteriota bacterium]|nr:MAG: PD40 domain-containing protein [candidate division Zixibacteria bacterium]
MPRSSLTKFSKVLLITTITALFVFLPVESVLGQFYFGKNKVQYTDFDWQVMTTEHFRIYFYTEEAEIASIAAKSAEDSYRELAARFNHEVPSKVPLIIYSTPGFFSQTNVIPYLLPEAVAGFTEFLKGRVVVPFHGSYYDFDHVIRHELVHVFTLSKLDAVTGHRARTRFTYPPVWFTEGLAEFWSKDWDTQADMVIKDMVLNGMLFDIDHMYQVRGTYYMYKLGESICHFIDSTYGSDKLVKIFENWHKGRSFDDIVEITLGDKLKDLSEKWEYSLKKKYYPEFDSLGLPDMESKKVTKYGYNVEAAPLRWDDGSGMRDWVVFKANRMGYSGIYMKPAIDGEKNVRTLVKGERSSDYESLHLLRSGIDATNSGQIIFSSKSKEKDVLYLYDLRHGRVTKRYELENLAVARSPRFSRQGDQVVFTGTKKSGVSDLYIMDLADGSYRELTNDFYYDTDPTFTYDGEAIVFSSDRSYGGQRGGLNLYKLDLASGHITRLTSGFYVDQSPECSKDGIYFSSNRQGTFNLFFLGNDGTLSRQSAYATGALDPRLSHNDTKLIYTGYQKLGYQIYTMDLPEEATGVSAETAADVEPWKPEKIASKFQQASIRYDTDYSFDIAQSSIGYDPVYGSLGGFQLAMSDVLGNHAIHFLLTNTATSKDEFLESFNVGVTYINRENRLNWGVGAFHLYDEYFNDYDGYYFERQAGGISLFSYPFSKFHRVDFTTLARYSKRERAFGLIQREKFLLSNYVSWVYDNSLWEYTGPIEGRRYNLTVGITSCVSDARAFSRQASVDLRHYFRLGRFSAFASRLFAFSSSGIEPQRIYFGGSWSFRGYGRRAFYNRNVLFASHELRFPLIDNLVIGFPFGGLGFRGIRGALFFDVGSAWDDDFDRFLGSFGAGFRVSLGYFLVLRFDFTRTTDFDSISPNTDFDFFFGWNF